MPTIQSIFSGLRSPMTFLDWLTSRKKSLSRMTRSELRRQELLLEKDRTRLLTRINKLATDKQGIFERGATEKTPELRRALAQEFEVKTTEQLMLSRQLNIRSKEMLTVSRLRMLRENADRTGQSGRLGLISQGDIVRLGKLIESDVIKAEVYMERLDEILSVGMAADEQAGSVSEAGRTVMNVWEKMDAGDIADAASGFDEADRSVRAKHAAPEA